MQRLTYAAGVARLPAVHPAAGIRAARQGVSALARGRSRRSRRWPRCSWSGISWPSRPAGGGSTRLPDRCFVGSLPVEEVLFFLVVPVCAILAYEGVRFVRPQLGPANRQTASPAERRTNRHDVLYRCVHARGRSLPCMLDLLVWRTGLLAQQVVLGDLGHRAVLPVHRERDTDRPWHRAIRPGGDLRRSGVLCAGRGHRVRLRAGHHRADPCVVNSAVVPGWARPGQSRTSGTPAEPAPDPGGRSVRQRAGGDLRPPPPGDPDPRAEDLVVGLLDGRQDVAVQLERRPHTAARPGASMAMPGSARP